MERSSFDRYVEPPPRLIPTAEALPHLAGLALVRHRGELADEIELHPTEPLRDAFDDKTAQEMLNRAVSLDQVRGRLGRGRVKPIGVSRRGETGKGERRTYLVVAYDYTANVAVEITLDEHGELLGIRDERYQPPPIQSEIEAVIGLARADERLSAKVGGLVAMAIPYSGADNEFANQRVLEVLFGCRGERLPRYRAWVDLGAERVIHAGEILDCCTEHGRARP
jgi:hypothetical protein